MISFDLTRNTKACQLGSDLPRPDRGPSRQELLLLCILALIKIVCDCIYRGFQSAEYVYDNIDYLDHAKQYYYTLPDPDAFWHTFLHSFGQVRSPFQSLLIFAGKVICPSASFENIAYLLQALSLFALVVAALAICRVFANIGRMAWTLDQSSLVIIGILFCPLSIGLGRSTLVELPLIACIYAFVSLSSRLLVDPEPNKVCLLNLVFAMGMLSKFTFLVYIAGPLIVMVAVALWRRNYGAVLFSLIFQVMVQLGFCYNIVNAKPMLRNAAVQAKSFFIQYPEGMENALLFRAFGLPFVLCGGALVLYAITSHWQLVTKPGLIFRRWIKSPKSFLLQRIETLQVVLLGAFFLNLVSMLAVHLIAANRMVRFFYFIVPAIIITLSVIAGAILSTRQLRLGVSVFCVLSVSFCLMLSLPAAAGVCSSERAADLLEIQCMAGDSVDGTAYAARAIDYHVPSVIEALRGKIAPGSNVLLINPNPFFDHQTLYYHLRDTAKAYGFYFNIVDLGAPELTRDGDTVWRGASAVILKNFDVNRYQRVIVNGVAPVPLSTTQAARLEDFVMLELKQHRARQIYAASNPDGVVSVYLIGVN